MSFSGVQYLRETVYRGRAGNRLALQLAARNLDTQEWEPLNFSNVVDWLVSLVPIDGDEPAGAWLGSEHAGLVEAPQAGRLVLGLGGLEDLPEAGDYRLRVATVDGSDQLTQLTHEAHRFDVVLIRIADAETLPLAGD